MRAFLLAFFVGIPNLLFSQTAREITSRASALCEQGSYNQAIGLITDHMRGKPGSDSLYYYLGLIQTDYLKDHAKALKNFEKAVEINPRSAYGHFGIGKANLELDNLDAAVNGFSKALRIRPSMFEAAYNLGYTYYLMGWKETKLFRYAISNFGKAIALNPEYIDSYLMRGISYFQLSDYKKASKDFDYYQNNYPGQRYDSSFYYYGAFTDYYLNNYDRALERFNAYLTLDSLNTDVLYYRGVCYWETSYPNEAIADFGRYIESNPASAEAYLYLAEAYEFNENFDRAYLFYKKAESLGSTTAQKAIKKKYSNRLQKRTTRKPKVSFAVQRYRSCDEVTGTTSTSACDGVIINDPNYSLFIAILENDTLPANPSAQCDMWGHWFSPGGSSDRYKTVSYEWSRTISDDVWRQNPEVSYPVKVWRMIPRVSGSNILMYIWGKEEVFKDFEVFIAEFLDSFRIE